jgi:hypothetical protein
VVRSVGEMQMKGYGNWASPRNVLWLCQPEDDPSRTDDVVFNPDAPSDENSHGFALNEAIAAVAASGASAVDEILPIYQPDHEFNV